MTIQLNAEQERIIEQAIRAGVIRDADDVVDVGLEAIRQRLVSTAALNHEQWLRDLRAWVHGNSLSTPLLSDEAIGRESIHGTRGL